MKNIINKYLYLITLYQGYNSPIIQYYYYYLYIIYLYYYRVYPSSFSN